VDKVCFNILIFDHNTSKAQHLRIHKETLKIASYLIVFALLSTTFFFCDYIHVKKKAFELNRLRQETEARRSQIQFFSTRIEDLGKQLSKLKDFDRKIQIIANLERALETDQFIGIGGSSPSGMREKLETEKDGKGLVQQERIDGADIR
jgi:cell division protein FtsL